MAVVGDEIWVLESDKPYKCRVVDRRDSLLEVHFLNWNKRHDLWLKEDSPLIVDGPDGAEINVSQPQGSCSGSKNKRKLEIVGEDSSSAYNLRKRPSLSSEVVVLEASGLDVLTSVGAASSDVDRVMEPSRELGGGGSNMHQPPLDIPALAVPDVRPRAVSGQDVRQCALCSRSLSDRGVSCGECGTSFHADPLCLGVNRAVIEALVEDGSAVSYRCCKCRGRPVKTGNSNDNGMVNQMMCIIGGLVSEVKKLAETVASIQGVRGDRLPGPASENRPLPRSDNSVLNEVREICEREKRKSSIIIRGVVDSSAEEVIQVFQEICTHLDVGSIEVMELTRVAPSVWRGKIMDVDKRYALLSEARRLRSSSDFRNIYVQRDLTYRQRMEVIEKRSQRNSQASGANEVPVSQSRNADENEWTHLGPTRNDSSRGGGSSGRGQGNNFRGRSASARAGVNSQGGVHCAGVGSWAFGSGECWFQSYGFWAWFG